MKPLSTNLFPLSFEGEGDKGGEVSKHSPMVRKQAFTSLKMLGLGLSLAPEVIDDTSQEQYSSDNADNQSCIRTSYYLSASRYQKANIIILGSKRQEGWQSINSEGLSVLAFMLLSPF